MNKNSRAATGGVPENKCSWKFCKFNISLSKKDSNAGVFLSNLQNF